MNSQCRKIIIRDCGSALQVIQSLELWNLHTLQDLSSAASPIGRMKAITYGNVAIVKVIICSHDEYQKIEVS